MPSKELCMAIAFVQERALQWLLPLVNGYGQVDSRCIVIELSA